jgi:hypothetical protein
MLRPPVAPASLPACLAAPAPRRQAAPKPIQRCDQQLVERGGQRQRRGGGAGGAQGRALGQGARQQGAPGRQGGATAGAGSARRGGGRSNPAATAGRHAGAFAAPGAGQEGGQVRRRAAAAAVGWGLPLLGEAWCWLAGLGVAALRRMPLEGRVVHCASRITHYAQHSTRERGRDGRVPRALHKGGTHGVWLQYGACRWVGPPRVPGWRASPRCVALAAPALTRAVAPPPSRSLPAEAAGAWALAGRRP